MKTTRLKIDGMSCDHCVRSVETALRNQDGVRSAAVHLDPGAAEVEYDPDRVAPEQLIATVQEQGYNAAIGGQSAGGAR